MDSRPRSGTFLLLVLGVLVVAIAARLGTLYWSPLPSTLDGFQYVSFAETTIKTGTYPLERFRADSFVFTTLLAVSGAVTGVRPLVLAQPVVAITGGASCLVAVALVCQLGRGWGWTPTRTQLAAGITGFGLALEGLYVRRSGTTDEEALAFLLVPVFAIAAHRFLHEEYPTPRWGLLTGILFGTFPLLHTFSSLMAGLTLTGVLGAYLARIPSRQRAIRGIAVVVAFWVYIQGYYTAAEDIGLFVPYVDRVTAYPGLFVAWLIILLVAVAWFQRTSARPQRFAIGVAIGAWFLALGANTAQSVFPGTQTTPPFLLVIVAAFVVPVVAALIGLPIASWNSHDSGQVVLALLLAPLTAVYFSLTASLTPEYYDTAIRGHIFVHIAVFILAGLGVSALLTQRGLEPRHSGLLAPVRGISETLTRVSQSRVVHVGLVGLVIVSSALTLPVAFVHLDTLTAPAVISQSQFAAAGHTATHANGTWTTDDPLERVAMHTYPTEPNPSQRAVTVWLQGGSQPECLTLAQASWATTGAHLFPAPAERIEPTALTHWRTHNNVVYETNGLDSVFLVQPRGSVNATTC